MVSPDGNFVYVASTGEGDGGVIAIYERNSLPRNDGSGTNFDGLMFKTAFSIDVFNTDGENATASLTISPDGENVYVSGPLGLDSFVRDAASGTLTGQFPKLDYSVAELKFLSDTIVYGVEPATDRLLVFSRSINGALTKTGENDARLDNPKSVVISPELYGVDTIPAGRFVYVASAGTTNSISVFDEFSDDGSDTAIDGVLHHRQVLLEGVGGVRGLLGVHTLQLSAAIDEAVLQFGDAELIAETNTIKMESSHGLRTEQSVLFAKPEDAPQGIDLARDSLYVRKIDDQQFQMYRDLSLTAQESELDAATNTFNTALPHRFQTGMAVQFPDDFQMPTGVEFGIDYFVRAIDADSFQLFTTLEAARSGDTQFLVDLGQSTGPYLVSASKSGAQAARDGDVQFLVELSPGDGTYALKTSIPAGAFVYALGTDANTGNDSIAIFQRDLDSFSPTVGELTFQQIILNRVGNRSGSSNDGLFEPNSIVASSSNQSTVFIGSGFDALVDQAPGGFVSLHNNLSDSPSLPTSEMSLTFSNINRLTVTTGSGVDDITVHEAANSGVADGPKKPIPLEVSTGGGKDSLAINDAAMGAGGQIMTMANLGADRDLLTIRTRGDASLVDIDSGDGADEIVVESIAGGTILDLSTGQDDQEQDLVRVGGQGLQTGSQVRLSKDATDQFSFESERDVTTQSAFTVTASNIDGVHVNDASGGSFGAVTEINIFSGGGVTAQSLDTVSIASLGEELVAGAAVAEEGSSVVQGVAQATVAEGKGIILAGFSNIAPNACDADCERETITYAWDLNRDGRFTELVTTESQVMLSWDELVDYGFDDGPLEDDATADKRRRRDIPLRIKYVLQPIDANRAVNQSQSIVQYSDTSVTVDVTSSRSVLTVEGTPTSTLTPGVPYVLSLSDADGQSGNVGADRIVRWIIDWGDGTIETIRPAEDSSPGDVIQAPHYYQRPGEYQLAVSAVDDDGVTSTLFANSPLGNEPFAVNPADGQRFDTVTIGIDASSISAGGPYQTVEGQGIVLQGSAAGMPIDGFFRWLINDLPVGTGTTLELSWDELGSFGIDDNGTFDVQTVATYRDADGVVRPDVTSAATTLTILNVAPTARLVSSGPTTQGTPAVLRFVDVSQPIALLDFSYDFGDGNGFVSGSAEQSTPAGLSPGTRTVTGRIDDGSQIVSFTTELTILDQPPELRLNAPIDGVIQIVEGETVTLQGTYANPGNGAVTFSATSGVVSHDDLAKTWTWTYATNDDSDGTQAESITLTDAEDSNDRIAFDLLVENAAPDAAFILPGDIIEGATGVSIGLTLAGDASTVDVSAGLRYAFDFGNDGTFEIGDGTYAAGCVGIRRPA
ncbi:MAG: PKD domain-containing protein [Pirellulaceae bacterium]